MELILNNISYIYPGNIHALKDIDLKIYGGKFYGLLGVNGSGKSTLLNIISRLTPLKKDSQGKVYLNQRDINSYKDEELYQIIGMVFQNPEDQLFVNNVLEDVAFGPLNSGLSPTEAKEKAKRALDQVGARDLADRSIDQLSFGQKKRIALAGVLAMEPKLLLLDEPTAGLDPKAASSLLKLFKRLNKEKGITIFMATQDVDLIPLAADELIVLEGGKIIKHGTLKEVINPRTKETLRKAGLRLPRISHLYEIIQAKSKAQDEIEDIDDSLPLTIGQAKDKFLDSASAKDFKFFSEFPGSKKVSKKNAGETRGELKKGFTTGAAAAAASKAALKSIIDGKCPEKVTIKTLIDKELEINIDCISSRAPSEAGGVFYCGVKKDGGDDPDITNNLLIMASLELTHTPGEIKIYGGEGVGTVTKPGLPVKEGEKAINPGPKKMIKNNLANLLPHSKGAEVTIWVPEGKEAAKKTLNEKLGIVGGISILGSTGIVEPLSTEAYKDSLYLQLHQVKALNLKTAVFTPGKIGENNAKNYNVPEENIIFMGNFVGYMLSSAAEILEKDTDILIFGHAGKLSKVAAGVFQTHSKMADARREVFITHSALEGVEMDFLEKLYNANTTEEIMNYLTEYSKNHNVNYHQKIFNKIAEKITSECEKLINEKIKVGTILTDREGNILAADKKALNICEKEGWNQDE